jgi:hypothetical protein
MDMAHSDRTARYGQVKPRVVLPEDSVADPVVGACQSAWSLVLVSKHARVVHPDRAGVKATSTRCAWLAESTAAGAERREAALTYAPRTARSRAWSTRA